MSSVVTNAFNVVTKNLSAFFKINLRTVKVSEYLWCVQPSIFGLTFQLTKMYTTLLICYRKLLSAK